MPCLIYEIKIRTLSETKRDIDSGGIVGTALAKERSIFSNASTLLLTQCASSTGRSIHGQQVIPIVTPSHPRGADISRKLS